MITLQKLREDGFNLSLNNENNIVVSPISKLTSQQKEFIQKNKVALVCELQLEKIYLHWHVITETDDCYFSVIPPSPLATIKAKFPQAILIEPVNAKQ
jgi:hypothetical protein